MKTHYIHNQEFLDLTPDQLFHRSLEAIDTKQARSRQESTLMLRLDDQDLVLKSYFRGGLPGRFIRNTYVYTGLERTRMWREFRLLQAMDKLGLPVPTPLAARCEMTSPLTYRGELIMRRINNCQTLADTIAKAPLTKNRWARIGEVIADFHRHQICHQDLNATNILLTEDESVHLIDFDKCDFRGKPGCPVGKWARDNLRRLRRSLSKHSMQKDRFHFEETHWEALQTGYSKVL